MLDLSVIIPIYNTPTETLERCFASIRSLGETKYEVLLIDDGSMPPVGEFCIPFAEENPAFRYIRQENGGVSSARNKGLDLATGKYITFLDADDILLGEPIAKALAATSCDLVILDTDVEEKGQKATWYAFDRDSGAISKEEILQVFLATHRLNGPYGKLCKTELLKAQGIRFDQNFVTGEDWDFGCRFALCSETIEYYKASAYLYYRDGGNAKGRTRRFPDTMLDNTIAMFDKKEAIAKASLPEEMVASVLSDAAVILIENLFNTAADLMLLKKLTPERKKRLIDASKQASPRLLPDASGKTRKKAWILAHCFPAVRPLAYLRELYLKVKH